MIGYQLSEQEKENINGKFFSNVQFFICSKDINNTWFILLSIDDENIILDTEYKWILNCPKSEYIAPINTNLFN